MECTAFWVRCGVHCILGKVWVELHLGKVWVELHLGKVWVELHSVYFWVRHELHSILWKALVG